MIFKVYYGCDENASEVPLDQCTLVIGTLGRVGLGFPITRERFPPNIKKGDKFIYKEHGKLQTYKRPSKS
jgi:hypothetical protein